MAIGMAQQQGNMVYVYDENNYHLWSRTGEMHGYTSNTVTIKQGNMLYMYNEKKYKSYKLIAKNLLEKRKIQQKIREKQSVRRNSKCQKQQ